MDFLSSRQLHIGPVTLQTRTVLLLGAAAAGSIVLFFLLRRDKDQRRLFFDTLSTGLLIVFAGWKIFPLFYSFHQLLTHPLTLLYTPGGIRGIMFGTGAGILYFLFTIFFGKKKGSRRLLRPFLLFLGIVTILGSVLIGVSMAAGTGKTRDTAAPFHGTTLGGVTVSLESLRGKTVFLNFWATWCPPCRAELPTLVSFAESLHGGSAILLGIDAAASEKSLEAVQVFMQAKGITYPVIADTDGKIAAQFGITSLPSTVVLSPEGILLEKHTGVVDYFWLRSYLSAPDRFHQK